jgi:D-beta-D-heptose 7-phosphate kinase/D-beta-D-heptose 1-phosphate adenosyltransferase
MAEIIALKELKERLVQSRYWPNIKIVWTNGCFDLIHAGHIEFLKEAAKLGDILIVGLNSDKSVRAIKREPINNEKDRAKVLSRIMDVNYIIIFDDLEPSRMVKELKPDIAVKAGDWEGKKVPEKDIVEGYGGKFVFLPHKRGYSTTEMIRRIKDVKETR